MDATTALVVIEALVIIVALALYKANGFISPSLHAFNHLPLPRSNNDDIPKPVLPSCSSEINKAPPSIKYEVFLSFRGEDTRDTFTSHLYDALCKAKILTFIDYSLHKGDEISPVLKKAIQGSQIHVVIFSKDYASSTWCLNELIEILECKNRYGRTLIPVFYNINPSNVRKQSGSYGEALVKLKHRFKHNMSKIEEWKFALTQAANLAGWDSSKTKPESKLVKEIVKDICTKLNRGSSYDFPTELVGIERHVMNMQDLLCLKSPEVGIVGICGMGGIGKTTIAQALFHKLKPHFESYSFVSNVRENVTRYGLDHLLNKCLYELLQDKDVCNNYNMGSSIVKNRLQHLKILLVLDDVDNSIQVEDLIKVCDWCGLGSRIIITSRDMHVLKNSGAHKTYNVPQMEFHDALQLFNLNAFKKNKPTKDDYYFKLSKWAVNYCQGIPLALKVLGSFLYGRRKEEWESALQKLEKTPHMEVFNVMKLSFDGLDEDQKNMFLDMACFSRDNMQEVYIYYNVTAKLDITILKERCLISVDEFDQVFMHNLVKAMGREISRQQSIGEPAKFIRLWKHEEIYHVLTTNMGAERIRCISLNTCRTKRMVLKADIFRRMFNLRFLVFYKSFYGESSNLSAENIDILPQELIVFHWDVFPLKRVPLDCCAENLVILKMQESNLQQLWDGDLYFPNLKEIDLSYSKHLIKLPDLSQTPNVEEINLDDCISLLQIYSSNSLHKLWYLSLHGCSNLQSVGTSTHWNQLSYLQWSQCPLQSLPLTFCSDNLVYLEVTNSKLEQLWNGTLHFPNLQTILLYSCGNLVSLPDLSQTPNIEEISVSYCVNLVQVYSSTILARLFRLVLDDCKKLRVVNVGGNITHQGTSSSVLVVVYNYFDLQSLSFIKVTVKVSFMCSDIDTDIYGFRLKVESIPFTVVSEYGKSSEVESLRQRLSSLLPFVSKLRWLDVTSSSYDDDESHFQTHLSHFDYDDGVLVTKLTELKLQRAEPNVMKLQQKSKILRHSCIMEVSKIMDLEDLLREENHDDDCLNEKFMITRVPNSITCWSLLTELSLQKSEIVSIQSLSGLKLFGECDHTWLQPIKDVWFSVNGERDAWDNFDIRHTQQLYQSDSSFTTCLIAFQPDMLSFQFRDQPYWEEE